MFKDTVAHTPTVAPPNGEYDRIEIQDPTLKGGFVQTPRPILRCPTLTPNAKCLYALLLDYAWSDGHCFPGQERLAIDLGLTEKTVRKHLKELRTVRLIDWVRRGHTKTNIYFILPLGKAQLRTVKITVHEGAQLTVHEGENLPLDLDADTNTHIDLDSDIFPSKGTHSSVNSVKRGNGSTSHPQQGSQPALSTRGRPPKPTPDIDRCVRQITAELHDDGHEKSNVTHAMRVFRASGLPEAAFLDVLFEARKLTKCRGNIRKEATDAAPLKNRMPYLFSVLADLLSRGEQSPSSAPAAPAAQQPAGDPRATSQDLQAAPTDILWQKVLVELAMTVSTQTFTTHLQPTRLLSLHGEVATIAVPSQEHLDWLQLKLYRPIEQTLAYIVGRKLTTTFVVAKPTTQT